MELCRRPTFFAADGDYPSNDGVNGYAYLNTGQKSSNDSAADYGDSFTTGDLIGVAYDADNRLLYFYKNNTIQNSGTAAYTVAVNEYIPAVGTYGNGAIGKINFGHDSSFDGVAAGQNNPDGLSRSCLYTTFWLFSFMCKELAR